MSGDDLDGIGASFVQWRSPSVREDGDDSTSGRSRGVHRDTGGEGCPATVDDDIRDGNCRFDGAIFLDQQNPAGADQVEAADGNADSCTFGDRGRRDQGDDWPGGDGDSGIDWGCDDVRW